MVLPHRAPLSTLESHLGTIKTLDDQPIEDWVKKAVNSEKEFEIKEEDDEMEIQRK